MLKVLIIAYYFPPQTSVGVFRTTRFLRHFRDNDMDAEILTVKHPDTVFHPSGEKLAAEYEGYPVHYADELPTKWLWQGMTVLKKSFCRLWRKPFNEAEYARKWWFVDMEYGWMLPAIIKGYRLIKRYKPDVIYVSCPPFSASLVGYVLKKITGVPLVLDFRDGWVYSSYRDASDKRDVAIAKRVLSYADHLIVTSSSDKEHYSQHLPVSLIYNGYDYCHCPNCETIIGQSSAKEGGLPYNATHSGNDEIFTLLHLGSWGTFNSSPVELLECLKQCDFPWKLISAGSTNDYLKEYADKCGVGEHMEYVDSLPKNELPELINKASILLIVKGETAHGRDSHIAAKVYDSLATGKPTLAIVPEGDTADMLIKYSNNNYICKVDNLHEMLADAYESWKSGKLVVEAHPIFLENFSGEVLTKQLKNNLVIPAQAGIHETGKS